MNEVENPDVIGEKKYDRAKKRVKELKDFYHHLAIYIIVNIGLFILNMISSPGHLWFYWPLFGWGIGIISHAISVFGFGRLFGKSWEERKIKEIMEKEESKDCCQ